MDTQFYYVHTFSDLFPFNTSYHNKVTSLSLKNDLQLEVVIFRVSKDNMQFVNNFNMEL